MSEATTKALTDIVYDPFGETPDAHGLDNEQVYNLARTAAEAIGTTKAIIRTWLAENGITGKRQDWGAHWLAAVREVSS